jgi:hypothetical protein
MEEEQKKFEEIKKKFQDFWDWVWYKIKFNILSISWILI